MRKTLAEIAIAEGLVDEARLARARRAARHGGEPLVAVLVTDEQVDAGAILGALARYLRLPVASLDAAEPDAIRELPQESCRRHRVLPLAVEVPEAGERILRVAMADPTDADALADLELSTGCRILPALTSVPAVEAAIERAYRGVVTAVTAAPRRVPFGGRLDPSSGQTIPTERGHRIDDEADLALRHRALLDLLIAKGVITQEEYVTEVKRLLQSKT